MDLSLLRSTSILNKYSLNAIPRDDGGDDGGSNNSDSWGAGFDAGVSFADSGNYFGAFDAGNNFSGGFDSNTFSGGGWDGGNNFGGGGVSYGDAGFGPGGFGTGGFGFNSGAYDYGGGNAFTGLGPGGGGWDSGPWGAGTFGYDQGFGGLYSNPTMDAWGPGSYSAWAGFGEPSGGFNNFAGPFGWDGSSYQGPLSGANLFTDNISPFTSYPFSQDLNIDRGYNPDLNTPQFYGPWDTIGPSNPGGAFNSFGLGPNAYGNAQGGWTNDFGLLGPQGSQGYGAGNSQLGYGLGGWIGGPAVSVFDSINPDPGFQAPAYDRGVDRGDLSPISFNELASTGKNQSFIAPDINPLGYPSSTWDAASYFGSPNATTQPQNSRDSFDSRYGEWGAPNANPYVANVVTDPNNFEGRFGGPYPAPMQWNSDTYLGPDFGRAGNIAEWGRAAPSNVASLDYPTDTFDSRFGGPYPAPAAPDYGPNNATIHGRANDYSQDLSDLATASRGPAALATPDNFDARFGNLPAAQDLTAQMIAAQELGDQGRAGSIPTMQYGNISPQNVAYDFLSGGPYEGVAGGIGRGMDLSGQITANMPWGQTVNAPPMLSPGWATPGLLSGLDLSLSNKGDALNNYASNANQNMSPYGALQQALEARGGIMPTLNETGRSINEVMDAAKAAQMTSVPLPQANPLALARDAYERADPTLRGEGFAFPGTQAPSRGFGEPSRGGEATTRGGRADLSPDNRSEARSTAQTIVNAAARGENIQGYMASLLAQSRDPSLTQAQRTAALDALNGIISAVYGRGPNQSVGRGPYGGDPDPFIASQLRQGR